MSEGAIVVRAGWASYPDHIWLARHGRVLSVHGSEATVEWQAGRREPTMTETVSLAALHHLAFRSTTPAPL